MNKLSKEKRNQLIMIGLGTVGVIAALWFLVIAAQRDKIHEIDGKIASTTAQIDKMQQTRKAAGKIEAELKEDQGRLAEVESTMPSGDWYLWVNTTLRKFNSPSYHVEMPVIGAPVAGAVTLLPAFPYNQLSVSVNGTAYYEDLGKFLADFENRFPCMRIQNLNLEPGYGPNADDREKLTFHMEIISLTRANPQ
jgi:Type II secretion system (T2SS), protein M subtype b